jgi:signal transduction histidine kinase
MTAPPKHQHENERLKLLKSYNILDTLSETDYDNLTAIAADICNTPISLVTLIDHNRQWFKSHHGLDISETPREHSFCGHAIVHNDDVFVVADARKDKRFCDNPLVVGEPKVIFYAGIPLIGEDGLPLGTLCIIDHKPKRLNKSQINTLKALSRQVMNLFELRKNKITLERTLRDLENVNNELEKFAYVAAHDLKSPLNNINLLTNLFSQNHDSGLDVEGREIIAHIKQSSINLKKLIDGLLAHGKTGFLLNENKSEVNLRSLINEIKSLFICDGTCQIKLNTTLDVIFVNRMVIERVLMNLVSNAIKYNDKKATVIEIEVLEEEEYYRISVKDNGPGILKEHQGKIFEIFTIATMRDKFGETGNGIGLATVKKTIEALNGEIFVASEMGKGSVFTFTLERF